MSNPKKKGIKLADRYWELRNQPPRSCHSGKQKGTKGARGIGQSLSEQRLWILPQTGVSARVQYLRVKRHPSQGGPEDCSFGQVLRNTHIVAKNTREGTYNRTKK